MEDLDYLPISAIGSLAYCARQFFYQQVWGETALNAALLAGRYAHEELPDAGTRVAGGVRLHTRVAVHSDALRLTGVIDLVEERRIGGRRWLRPVLHRVGAVAEAGRRQLCAQALCLEERTGEPVEQGEIRTPDGRRRAAVVFDAALRSATRALVAEAHALAAGGRVPALPPEDGRCDPCAMAAVCLPAAVRRIEAGAVIGGAAADGEREEVA